MPELNEDILAEPNAEMMNQADDSGSLDESVLQANNMDASDEKTEDGVSQNYIGFVNELVLSTITIDKSKII